MLVSLHQSLERSEEAGRRALLGNSRIGGGYGIGLLQELERVGMLGYKEITHEGREPREDRLSLEALTHQLIQKEQDTTMVPTQEELKDADEVGIVEDIQALQRMLVGDMSTGEAGDTVKH